MKPTWIAGALVLMTSTAAHAQVCEPTQISTSLQYLRRLSIDLRHRIPSGDEAMTVVAETDVPDALIDDLLASPEFTETMQLYVRDLLWGELRQGLNQGYFSIVYPNATFASPAYWNPFARSRHYRGGNGFVSCKDEPAEFDANGRPITTPGPQPNSVQEGWIDVIPYWDTSTTVRVCAFDASEVEVSSTGRDCGTNEAFNEPECGCGPNLRYCQTFDPVRGISTTQMINDAMYDQVDRLVARILTEGRPFSDLLTIDELELNGPLAHYLRYQTGTSQGALHSAADQGFTVPQIPFDQANDWQPVVTQSGYRHSGVLSTMFFLLKFQSNRSRANRFYNAFLCQYFQAPQGGLPDPSDPCNDEPNLNERCGCSYCHAALEPASAYWGRWAERGILPLTNAQYPTTDPACESAPFPPHCRDFYFTEAGHPDEAPYVGMLSAYVFADPYVNNIEDGPAALASQAVDSGQFAECTVRRLWTRFVARPPTFGETDLVQSMTGDFVSSGYDVRSLVKAIVKTPQYAEGAYCGLEEAE